MSAPAILVTHNITFCGTSSDNCLIRIYIWIRYSRKNMFLKVKGKKYNRPVKGWGSTRRFGARSECGHQPNSPARLSLTTVGGGTTPLFYTPPTAHENFTPTKFSKNDSRKQKLIYELVASRTSPMYCSLCVRWRLRKKKLYEPDLGK